MPQYDIAVPGKGTFRVDSPTPLTDEQAWQAVQNQVNAPPPEKAGFSLKDLALSLGQGVGGGAQAMTDIVGANNAVSKGLSGLQQAAGETMTPERQAEIRRRQEIKKKAEGNTWEEVKATLGGFAEAPLQTLAQGVGSMAPMIAATALVPEAVIPAVIARLTAFGVAPAVAKTVASSLPASTVGAIMGVGGQKGQDYETVKRELKERNVPEEEAERLAQKAAEYSFTNAPRQIAGGAAGALEGALGVESLIGRAGKKLPKTEGPPKNMPEPTWSQAIGKNVLEEAAPEAIQSAVGTAGTNVALTQAGVPTDISQGVLAGALHDALVGGILGAGASPLKMKEMRQEYVSNEIEAQKEYQKQQREAIAAAKKKLDEQLEMTKNPIGSFTVDELGPELAKTIEQHRIDTGKPALTSYALDDVIDALPGVDKAKENDILSTLVGTKTGHAGEVYTPTQVIEAAQAKNVDSSAPSFADFLSRTTGISDPMQMSQQQIHAAVTSLNNLPGFAATQALPEGTNATRYSPEQYTMAIDGLNAKMDALGKDDLSFKETTQTIETATGLKGSAVNALLNDANRSGEIVTENQKVSVPSRTMPTGYGISEEVGPEQEVADAYDIMRGDEKLFSAPDEKSATELTSKLERTTGAELKRVEAELKAIDEKTAKSEDELNRLTIEGKFGTPEYKAAEKAHQDLMDASMPTIAELVAKKESYSTPLEVIPTGVKKVKPTSYVVRKGEEIQTVAQDRAAAEQAIFQDLSDADLQDLAKRPSPALQQRVNAEIQRRAALPPVGAPATAATPEQQVQLDKLKTDLPAMLNKFGLKDVGLKIVSAIEGGADGSYEAKLIQIALDAVNPVRTLRHEAIHALKELGFFTPQQWAVLERQAKNEWVQKYLKDKSFRTDDGRTISRYEAYKTPGIASKEGLSEEAIIEEAIADAFGDFDATKAPPGLMTALLNKLRNFFAALRNALTGNGFQTYEDVFGKVERGELKGTAPAVGGKAKMALKTEKYGMLNPAIEPKYEKVLNDIIDEMKITPEELASTSLMYQTGKAGIEQFEGPDIGRLPAVVQHLQDMRRQSGLPLLNTEKPEDRKTLARLMAIEAMAAIRSGGANLEWYDSVINKTLGMAGLKYPELNTDPNARSAFRVAMAVTSQGLNVEDNLAFAMKVYDSFRKNQRFPEVGQGADQGAMVSNFKLANALLDDMGPDLMRQFLETEFTVDEMRSAGFDIKGELKDEKVLGSSVFGPKIGFGFYSNLNGNFEPTTMDMWFMRTIGRLTGNLKDFDPELYKEQLGKFRNALNVKGNNGVFANQFNEADVEAARTNDDAAEALARKVKSAHERDYKVNRAGYNDKTREKSKLVGAAESMINSLDKPRDAPSNGSERRNLRDVVRQMVDIVQEKYGKRVPPASLQAAIWYPEQELYKALGVRLRVTSQNYAGAMEKILTKEGYNAGQLSTAAKSGSRTTQRLANAPVSRKAQAAGTQPYKVGPLETKQREEFLEKYRTKAVIEQERETPRRKKVVFEVAPDPNNVELTKRWRSLDQATRLNISEKIARSIVRKAMADFDVDGYIAPQVGSYMDDTNPSFALFLNAGNSVEISKFIGYALSQDSMMVISPKPAKGLDKVSAITVDINTQDPVKIDKIYQKLREIKVDGETPIGGQTTMNGKMILLNYSNVDSQQLATLIDDKLDNDYNVLVGDVYSAFPEKESYNYGSPSDDPRGKRGAIRERSRALRDEATDQLQRELGEPAAKRGRGRKLSLPLITPEAKNSEQMRGIVSDETLNEVQEVLNTYKGKPKIELTNEQRSKGEKMLTPFLRKAGMIKPKFTKDVNEIADAVGGTVRSVGLKSMGRSVEKLWKDTENGLLGQPQGSDILDLLRTTIVVDNESQIQPTIDLLTQKFGRVREGVKRLHRIKDRFAKPLNGYRDILTNVKLPNGLVAEIQINVPVMIAAKNTGHVVYAMSRVLPEGSAERIRLEKLSGKFYEEAYEFSQKAKSPSTAGSARANVSGETGTSGLLAKTVEPSLSFKTGQESPKTQTVAPSGTLNIPASSKETSIKESKKSLKTSFSTAEEAEDAAYQKAPPTTPAFKQFFGRSVVKEEGRPQVMYHSSPKDFFAFRERKPIFISPSPFEAEYYGKRHFNGAVRVYPLWVRAERPFDYENPEHVDMLYQAMVNDPNIGPEFAYPKERIASGDWSAIEDPANLKAIKKFGFDSFYVLEGGTKNLAVFDANQLKSVTGNSGEFGETKDMRFSLREAGPFDLDPNSEEKPTSQWPRMEEPGGFEAKPGDYITVLRLAKMQGLNNTNAASTDGMSTYLSMVDDNEVSAGSEAADSDTIYAYSVQVPEGGFGNYQMVRQGKSVGPEGKAKAGREQAKYGGYWYSFPEGTNAELLGSISLADARASAAQIEREQADQQPWSKAPLTDEQAAKLKGNFDTIGTQAGTAALNMAFNQSGQPIRYSLRSVKEEVDSLPNGAAINSSINRITTVREEQGFFERIMNAFKPQSVDALRQQWLNRYNQLGVYDKILAEKMGGAALLADASAESAALMSDNAAAIAAMACGIEGQGGAPVYRDGFTTIDNSVKSPLELLMPLAKIGDPRIYQTYQFWAGAKRGKRLLDNGKDHTYTAAEIAYAAQLEQKYPEFKQVQKDWIEYNNGLMNYAVATGVLAPERAAEFMRYSDYIPFYRQLDGQDTIGPKLFQNISGVTPPKKLKGIKEEQEAPLADFLETVVRNTQSIIQSGMKNTAAQRAVGVAIQIGEAKKRNDVSYAPGVVTVLEKGKPVSYDVADQLFIDAVKSLNLPELPFLSIFSAPANLLRNMVTKDPGFMMANLMRDSLSAWVTSGAKMTPIASTISNFGKAIGGKDPAYLALRRAGVIGGYEFASDIKTSGSILGAALRRETGTEQGAEKALKPFNSLWRGLEKGTEASDAATRMAVYKDVMERTGNEAEAIFRAMEVLNFNRKGNLAIVRILTAAVPFLNARMQGLDVFYRAAFGKMASADAAAIQKSFFIRGATLMSLSAMYWFLTHDDEEYLKQEQETRDNNWLFPSAGIRIPTPFEVGTLFKTIPERLLEYSFGNDTGKDLADSMKRALVSTFGINPIPQAVLPLVEARTNYSFFTMRPIVGQGMEGVANEYQVAPGTSEFAKKVGKMLGESPIMIDHIMQGYTGSMGMYAVNMIDAIFMGNDASPAPSKRFEQMPVIKRFALDKEAKGTVTSYYDLKNSVDEVVRTMNLMERTGQGKDMAEYIKDHVRIFGMRDYVSSIEKDMKQLREAAVKIRSSSMDADAKRDALLAITKAQNQLTLNVRSIKKSISQ